MQKGCRRGWLFMRSKTFNLRLNVEMLEKVHQAAHVLSISRSDFIRMAVAKQLNKHIQQQKGQDLDWEELFSDKF